MIQGAKVRVISTDGKFLRTTLEWNPEDRWDMGHFTNKGRFLVYKPDSPRAYESGYVLRYYAVWEHYRGESVPRGKVIHHKNGDRKDDRIENLELMDKREHDKMHQKAWRLGVYRDCAVCGDEFYKPRWRLNSGHAGKYCSKKCRDERIHNR